MKQLRIVTAGLAIAALGACTAEVYRVPATATVAVAAPVNRWQDPSYFTSRVHDRVATIEQRVRADVQAGQVRTEAIDELISRRNQIDAELAQVAADGYVSATERDYVRAQVRDLEGLPVRYSLGVGGYQGNPYGGGPPSSYVTPGSGVDDSAWWN